MSGKHSRKIKAELIKTVQELGLNEQVRFYGAVKQSELADFYNDMDIFIFPTEREAESLGLVGLEAMACGTPVIGSNIGGLKDYIIDGYNGFFFETGNSKDLANKILRFRFLPPEEKKRISKNALQTAKKYDSKIENKRLVNKFKAMIK